MINRMPSSVLDKKIHSLVAILTRMRSPWLFIFFLYLFCSGLVPWLDKLSPKSIKCVIVGFLKLKKNISVIIPLSKITVSVDITFFEFVPYFSPPVHVTASETIPPLSASLPAPASTDSLPVSSVDTSKPPVSTSVRDFRYVYTYYQKVLWPVPTNSPVDCPPQPSTSFSDLDILIVLRKGKKSCTDHPFLNFISYDHI